MEVAKNLGEIGTFGIFALMVIYMILKYGVPAMKGEKKPNGKTPDANPAPNWELIQHQLAEAISGITDIKSDVSGISRAMSEGFEHAEERRAQLWLEHKALREACAATHGRPPGTGVTGEWSRGEVKRGL